MKSNGTMLLDRVQVIAPHGRQAWHRREDESPKAFKAFTAYRDLNERRTFEAVARLLQCSGANVLRWASRHRWHERTMAYDVWFDERQREELARDRMLARTRHTKLAVALEGIAAKAIAEWQVRIASGEPLNLTVEEIVALTKAGTALENRALGPEHEPSR